MTLHKTVPLAAILAACAPAASHNSTAAAPLAAAPTPLQRPVVIAHRGYSARAPEHTIQAYDLAFEAGADYIEQDLQMTGDGVLVVLHDETLDRTARGPANLCTGPVIEKRYAELRACDVGSWFDRGTPPAAPAFIPTLEFVLNRYGLDTRYYIETKNPEEAPGMEEALLRLLRTNALIGEVTDPPRVYVQSFSPASLEELHRLEPGLPLVQLFGRISSEEIQDSLASVRDYASGIGPHQSSVDEALVRAAHQLGLVVHPYTVNDETEMNRLLDLGVDGFFTDETEEGLEAVRRR